MVFQASENQFCSAFVCFLNAIAIENDCMQPVSDAVERITSTYICIFDDFKLLKPVTFSFFALHDEFKSGLAPS